MIPDTWPQGFEPVDRGPKWSDKVPPMTPPAGISTKPCPMDFIGSPCGARPVGELDSGKWGRHFGGGAGQIQNQSVLSSMKVVLQIWGWGTPRQARHKKVASSMYLKDLKRQNGSKWLLTRDLRALCSDPGFALRLEKCEATYPVSISVQRICISLLE